MKCSMLCSTDMVLQSVQWMFAVNKKFTYRTSSTYVACPTQVCTVGIHSVYNYCVPYRFGMLIMRTAKC